MDLISLAALMPRKSLAGNKEWQRLVDRKNVILMRSGNFTSRMFWKSCETLLFINLYFKALLSKIN